MNRVVIASNNPGKLRELRALLQPLGIEAVPQAEFAVTEAEEPHFTFLENALAKARHASNMTGLPALADALAWLRAKNLLAQDPLRDFVAAVSVGIVAGETALDLDYSEDSACDTDMNVVMTGAGHFVEIQGTAEKVPFTREQMSRLLDLSAKGISELISLQRKALATAVNADKRG